MSTISKLNESSRSELHCCETHFSKTRETKSDGIFRRMFFVDGRDASSQRRARILRFESLEERLALNAAPILQGLPDIVYLTPGTSYHVALDGHDDDGDDLTFEVETSNPKLFEATVLEGNRSVKFSVYQEKTQGAKDWVHVGDIIFELFEDEAPITTARFMEIVNGTPLVNDKGQYIDKSGKVVDTPVIVSYDGVEIHRILDGFMLQGGDVRYGTGYGGTGVKFKDEFSDLLQHSSRGIVSTANSGSNTNDSQFFITDNSTSWLDGKHNIFGFVTQGDDIREAVNSVATSIDSSGSYSVPVNALKTDNFQIINDTENGTLRLVVPEDAEEGETEVTVWVSDGVNDPVAYTFTVKVITEASSTWPIPGSKATTDNAYDYYLDIVAGETTKLTLPEYAVPGEVEYYTRFLEDYSNESNVKITVDGNVLTITAPENGGGIARFVVGAQARDSDTTAYSGYGNFAQYLSIFIVPSPPTVKLAEAADTGVKGDNITSRNNSGEGNELIFEISDVLEYADVTLYQGGIEVDATVISALKQDNGLWTWTVKTNITQDTVTLPDGTYSFYAIQTYTPAAGSGHASMESAASARLSITINTKAPNFVSPSGNGIFDAEAGKELSIQFRTEDHASGATKYAIGSVRNEAGNTVDVPAGATINETTGLFTWTPIAGQAQDYSFTITATNGAGFVATKTIEVVFQSGPDFEIGGTTFLNEGEEFELELKLTDETFEGAVEFSIKEGSLPGSVTYTLEKTGDHSAVFRWTTTEAHGPATYNPVFIVTDELGNSRKKDVTLTVNEIDQPPVFTNDFQRVYTLKEHERFSLQLRATDADIYPGEDNSLVYEVYGDYPDGIELNSNTGLLTWTPNESQGDFSFEITVRVTDKTGLYAEQQIGFFVEETDRPPVFADGESNFKNDTGKTFSAQVTAKDPDYRSDPNVPINQVVYSLDGDDIPEGMTIDPNTGELSWSVPQDYLGDTMLKTVYAVVFAYEVHHNTGQLGLSSSKSISIELTNKALMDALTDLRNQNVGDRAREIADQLNGMLTSDSFWMLNGGSGYDPSAYSSSVDYNHSSYQGFGDGLTPNTIGIDGTDPETEEQKKKKKKEKEGESEEEQNANPKTALKFLDNAIFENTLHEHDAFSQETQTKQVVKNTSRESYDYLAEAYGASDEYDNYDFYFAETQKPEEDIVVEQAPEMEDAIDMIIALKQ